jgi:hypothetical protein
MSLFDSAIFDSAIFDTGDETVPISRTGRKDYRRTTYSAARPSKR